MSLRVIVERLTAAGISDNDRVLFSAITVLAFLVLFPKIGDGLLANYDDCYYAQKAKEVLSSGDWITIRYAGRPKHDNPPFFIWLVALGFKFFGVSKFSAVFFSTLAGALAVALTYKVARFFYAPFTAYLASFFLLTTPYFTKFSRRAMTDVTLTFLYLVCFWGYLQGLKRWERGRRPYHFLLSGLAVGAAVMTKSVLGLFPLAVIVLFSLFSGRAKLLRHPLSAAAVVLAVLCTLPWFLGEYLRFGTGFLRYHFGLFLGSRGLTVRFADHRWYDHLGYFYDLMKNGWPWVLLFLAGTAREAVAVVRRRLPAGPARDGALFLVVWIFFVIGALSIPHERKLWYIMPAFPAMAAAAASLGADRMAGTRTRAKVVLGTASFLLLAFLVIALTPIKLTHPRKAHYYQLAMVASRVVPEGEEVLNLNVYYWSINNIFYFYSGRCVTEPIGDDEEFVRLASRGRFGIVSLSDYQRLFAGREGEFPVVAECRGWVLFKGGSPVPASLPGPLGFE